MAAWSHFLRHLLLRRGSSHHLRLWPFRLRRNIPLHGRPSLRNSLQPASRNDDLQGKQPYPHLHLSPPQATILTFTPSQFWDSITKEDLEFSVGAKVNNWDLKAQLLTEEEKRNTHYQDSEYESSMYYQAPRGQSVFGGSNGH